MTRKQNKINDPALTDLAPQISSAFGLRQLSDTLRALPIYAGYHLIATVIMSVLVQEPKGLLHLWQVASAVATILIVGIIIKSQGFEFDPKRSEFLLRAMPMVGIGMAAIWSVPAIEFINPDSASSQILIYGITLIVWALGVLTWLRLPSVAVSYATFVGVVMCWSIYNGLAQNQLLFTLVCVAFWLSLIGLILTAHFDFEKRTRGDLEIAKQSETIKLLLNDFERDTRDWLWETNANGKLIYFSPRLAEVFAISEDELREVDFFDFLKTKDFSQRENFLASVSEAKSESIDEYFVYSSDAAQSRWRLKARILFEDDGSFKGYRGVGRDVTAQYIAEAQIVSAKEAAEGASAAKSQFLAVISHELRTPINAIVGFCEVLNSEQNDHLSKVDRKNYLSSVIESARHLQNLINDILDATRLERGSFRLVEQNNDPAEILEAALKMCRNQADSSNISIVAHIIDDVSVLGDLTRIKQVLLNLISNAIKFSPSGSIVHVDMQRGPEQQLIIAVRDAGIGISTEDAVRVFEPFVQLDESSTRSFGGMGLGLAIARRIARLHDGDVTLEGMVGIGTEAKLILPAARVFWAQPVKVEAGVAA